MKHTMSSFRIAHSLILATIGAQRWHDLLINRGEHQGYTRFTKPEILHWTNRVKRVTSTHSARAKPCGRDVIKTSKHFLGTQNVTFKCKKHTHHDTTTHQTATLSSKPPMSSRYIRGNRTWSLEVSQRLHTYVFTKRDKNRQLKRDKNRQLSRNSSYHAWYIEKSYKRELY